jgi:hypothetical protein
MEAIWVVAEMRAGGAYAHSVIALDAAGAGSGGHRPESWGGRACGSATASHASG